MAVREYEVFYILRPDLEDDAVNANMERFKGVIEQFGGEVTNLEKWSKRRLAYEINKYKEGLYILLNFKGPAEVAQEIDRLMKINEDVLRHIIIREDDK